LKFSEGIIYEDYAVIPVFALYAKKITLINECLYNYLIRAGSSMNQMKFNPKLRDILYASDALMDNLNKAEKKYEEEFEYAIFMNAVRGPYFRLRYFKEGKPLIIEMIDWYKKNFPNWKKNKYLKKDKIKFKVYNYLITRKQFWLLNILKRR